MRSFVRTRGKQRAFWNILRHSASVGYTTSAGTSGRGKQVTVALGNWASVDAEVARLVIEKLAEGYVETTNDSWHGGFSSPLRTSLEDALAEDPDDLAAHMAYADHLTELGDPRGEFIQVQLALEDANLDAAERAKLRKREKALLKAHERTWLGPMAGFWIDSLDQRDWNAPQEFTWRRGWIDALAFRSCSPHVADAVKARLPLLRCVREFRILAGHHNSDRYYLLKIPDLLRNVRVFQVGSGDQNDIGESVSAHEFYRKMPRLEELHLVNGDTPFSESFPHLRQLTAHAGMTYPLHDLAKNKSLANLTHLSLWPRGIGNDSEENIEINEDGGRARISRTGAVALFRSKDLAKVQHLTLRNSDLGDEGLRALVASGILKRLRTLDLLGGCVTDAGARTLADCPDLRNLEALNLSENMLAATGLAVLRPTGVPLSAARQLGLDALETGEYLYSGDCE